MRWCARRRARIAGMRVLAAGEIGGELHLLVETVRTQWPLTRLVLPASRSVRRAVGAVRRILHMSVGGGAGGVASALVFTGAL
jgi:hypothetical protein